MGGRSFSAQTLELRKAGRSVSSSHCWKAGLLESLRGRLGWAHNIGGGNQGPEAQQPLLPFKSMQGGPLRPFEGGTIRCLTGHVEVSRPVGKWAREGG